MHLHPAPGHGVSLGHTGSGKTSLTETIATKKYYQGHKLMYEDLTGECTLYGLAEDNEHITEIITGPRFKQQPRAFPHRVLFPLERGAADETNEKELIIRLPRHANPKHAEKETGGYTEWRPFQIPYDSLTTQEFAALMKRLTPIAQALFKHWFVDFEFPDEKGKPYKPSGGKMVYNEKLEKEIPEGWEVKSIDEIAEFLNGLALQKFPATDAYEYLPVIKIRELKQGITDATDKANVDVPKEYIVNDGDILFSWSGSLEVEIWGHGIGALNQHLFKVSSEVYPKWFFYQWILRHLPEYRHIAEGKATTMGHIQRHHLKSSLVLVPEKRLLQRMDRVFATIIVSN